MSRQNLYFSTVLSALFFLVCSFIAWHHELWIDESYHYLLSKESQTIFDLCKNGLTSGHPVLWNILLFYYKIVAPGIFHMQILHCLIATLCVFLILNYSPFSRIEKIMIVFGYFFLYEYSVIAKNYILGFLIIFLTLVVSEKKKSFPLVALLLGFAANLHLFTLFISFFLFGYFWYVRKNEIHKKELFIAGLIFLSFCILSIVQIIPPADVITEYRTYDESSLFSRARFSRAFGVLSKGLMNFPDLRSHHFWNTNLIFNVNHTLTYFLSVALAILIIYYFRKTRGILILYAGPVFCIMAFVYMAPLAVGVRYWGYCYVMFIICAWLKNKYSSQTKFSNGFFRTILVIQFLVSLPVLAREYKFPFSNGKEAAAILKKSKTDHHPFFTEILALGPSLSAYSGKTIYYPSNKSFETFRYSIKHKKYTAMEFIMESVKDLHVLKKDTCVLVLKQIVPDSVSIAFKDFCSIQKIGEATGAIIPSENYYLYLLSATKPRE